MKTIIAIAFAIGCGGGSKPPVQEPKPAPETVQKPPAPDCAAVGTKLSAIAAQEDPSTSEASVKSAMDAVKTHCETDQWSAEARECFGTAETKVDAEGCIKFLTEAQLKAVGTDVDGKAPEPSPAAAAPAPAPKAEEPVRRSRGGTPKKQVPKSSDPCMGGE